LVVVGIAFLYTAVHVVGGVGRRGGGREGRTTPNDPWYAKYERLLIFFLLIVIILLRLLGRTYSNTSLLLPLSKIINIFNSDNQTLLPSHNLSLHWSRSRRRL
jgi:hypothetical protein